MPPTFFFPLPRKVNKSYRFLVPSLRHSDRFLGCKTPRSEWNFWITTSRLISIIFGDLVRIPGGEGGKNVMREECKQLWLPKPDEIIEIRLAQKSLLKCLLFVIFFIENSAPEVLLPSKSLFTVIAECSAQKKSSTKKEACNGLLKQQTHVPRTGGHGSFW